MKVTVGDMSIELDDDKGTYSTLEKFFAAVIEIEKIRVGRPVYQHEQNEPPRNPFQIIGPGPIKFDLNPPNQDTFTTCNTTPQDKEAKP